MRWVQSTLNQVSGANLAVDGVMGLDTRRALQAFQTQRGLQPDGIAGPETRQALIEARRSLAGADAPAVPNGAPAGGAPPAAELGAYPWRSEVWQGEVSRSSSDYIRWIQTALNRILGLRLAVDGISGSQTRAAVQQFQQSRGLAVDGIVGAQTETALIAAGAGQPPQTSSGVAPVGSSAVVNTPLPQSGPGIYSTVSADRRFGQAATIQALQVVARQWLQAHPSGPRIGIGDISFRGGGPMSPHSSHQTGLDADIRLMRSDGQEAASNIADPAYSRSLTQELVNRIRANGVVGVKSMLFNDSAVSGVTPYPGHDNHVHVQFVPTSAGVPTPTPAPSVPYTPGTGSLSALRQNIINIARQELQRWGNGARKENETSMRPLLESYWRTGVGYLPSEANWWSAVPWSAAFISFVMRQAGAGRAFRYSAGHSYYIVAAKNNRLANNTNPFKAYRTTEVRPRPGDLVCKNRSGGVYTYDTIREGVNTHCDIVVEVQPGRLVTIGGNVSDSVKTTSVTIDANGFITSPGYFAVIQVA